MYCDMCGSDNDLFKCRIEGGFLNVCKNCSQYGEVIEKIEKPKPVEEEKKPNVAERGEIIQIIIPNYAKIVKNKRENLGLKQKELAEKIAEKESIIHQVESGHMEPPMELARKLESFLKVRLVVQYEEKGTFAKSDETPFMTLGDLIKIKKN
ncbi:MAG: multiprotein bridging factor aMBF1 [archaeon]